MDNEDLDDKEYISNLLCHFVGRSKMSDDDRYKLLVKIIKEDGMLKANFDESGKFICPLG